MIVCKEKDQFKREKKNKKSTSGTNEEIVIGNFGINDKSFFGQELHSSTLLSVQYVKNL